jgi:RNA polymerase sigma-70 factor (ECF subfamily)
LDHQRKKKSKKRFGLLKNVFGIGLQEEQVADFYHPGVHLENKEKSAILFKAMQNLPSQQRIAFTLIKIEGLNYEDTSSIMQISIKAIESLMHRAKQNLRNQLTNYYQSNK